MPSENLNIPAWITAFRLRTLPLAFSSIGMGGFLAASKGAFSWQVFLLCCLTTLFLQILSNLANDYGDSVHGADHSERKGPKRMVQSGAISLSQMKVALFVFTGLALVSGLTLLYISFGFSSGFLAFLVLGICAIAAAITYTAGFKPYGYMGLGDISVLLFFGLVGVIGTYFLQAQAFTPDILLPALTVGFFATAVLNVNNIRDIQSDKMAGKMSIPVRLGREKAVTYHWFLLISGVACSVVYSVINFQSIYQFLFLVTAPLLFKNGTAVSRNKTVEELDPYLKQMAISTLLFVALFGIGNLVS
jgi:1,4-dihydroxy-2-naphthoate polyprenyltransferase